MASSGEGQSQSGLRLRLVILCALAVIVGIAAVVPVSRQALRDGMALSRIKITDALGRGNDAAPAKAPPRADKSNPYRGMQATGTASQLLKAARSQVGAKYVLGARPRQRWALALLGSHPDRPAFDCSSFVAFVFLHGADTWISGDIAHTDEIWTQGGKLSLKATPAKTKDIIRGTMTAPPSGGFEPGDLLFAHWGAGGFWGHILIVSEHGYVIEAYPPDVHETREITELLDQGKDIGWMRIRNLD